MKAALALVPMVAAAAVTIGAEWHGGAAGAVVGGPRAAGAPEIVDLGPRSCCTGAMPDTWQVLSFASRHPTSYEMAPADEGVLLARAAGSASLLFTRLTATAREALTLRWRWRIDELPSTGDLRHTQSDDAAARVFVGFHYSPELLPFSQRLAYRLFRLRHGEYPPHAAIAYVWASCPAEGSAFRHPRYPRLHEIVLHSGSRDTGRFIAEERDVLADYREAFREPPPPVSHIAVMTDADDTGGVAAARFAGFTLEMR